MPVYREHDLRLLFAYSILVPSHSCLVSFTDSEGIEHSVRVPAESLYEAAVEAIAAFRRGVLAEMPVGPATRLTIRVKAPEERTHGHNREGALLARWSRGKPEREA